MDDELLYLTLVLLFPNDALLFLLTDVYLVTIGLFSEKGWLPMASI
jgi:hypothetical protein